MKNDNGTKYTVYSAENEKKPIYIRSRIYAPHVSYTFLPYKPTQQINKKKKTTPRLQNQTCNKVKNPIIKKREKKSDATWRSPWLESLSREVVAVPV